MTSVRRLSRGRHAAPEWPHVIVLDPWSAGLAVARRMTARGARVTMLALPGHDWETRSRGVRRLVEPFEPDGRPWIAALQRIAESDEPAVVLPATDQASELLVEAQTQLPENLRMFERLGRGHRALMDKQSADLIARRAGVRVPWTVSIDAGADLDRLTRDAPWPCVLKPQLSHQWRARYGERRAFLVNDVAQVAALVERPLRDGVGMLLSQYVVGGDDAVEEAIVVRLADGTYPVQFGCRKLRQAPRGFGATGLGESSPLPETMAIARRVLDEADFVGAAGVEVKRDERTGERWFLEVNVRIPAQWGLGDACGVQATPRLVAALMGQPLGPQPPLRPKVRFVAPGSDLDTCRELLREAPPVRRPLLALRLLRPYLGAGEIGLLDPRDPGPGLAWAATLAGRRVRRLAALLRRERVRTPSGT